MKLVFKIDTDGFLIEPVLLRNGETMPEDCVAIEPPHGGYIINGKSTMRFVDGEWFDTVTPEEEDKINGTDLESLKLKKIKELENKCKESILGYFSAEVDGVTYQFSCDDEAQKNFDKGFRAFEKAWQTEIHWTAYLNNERVRVLFVEETFLPVYMEHVRHINRNVSKLRDTLEPLVINATTKEELETIQW